MLVSVDGGHPSAVQFGRVPASERALSVLACSELHGAAATDRRRRLKGCRIGQMAAAHL